MTSLRQRMLEELCRHNYAPRTQQSYVAQIAKLARHYGTSPDELTREQVQAYQDLLTEQRVSWLPQAVAAMQFFFNKTLERDWKISSSGRPQKAQGSPTVLTLEEVSRLLAAATPLKAQTLLTTMYGCGLRVSEVIRLQVTDIDSQRMVIHIRQGKGRKDRYVPLGDTLLTTLRDYWRVERPASFLFPGSQPDKPWNVAHVREEFRHAKRIARIETPCTTIRFVTVMPVIVCKRVCRSARFSRFSAMQASKPRRPIRTFPWIQQAPKPNSPTYSTNSLNGR